VTIAGQTAPGDGIQIKNYYIAAEYGAHDIVIRHVRMRPGTDKVPSNINDCNGVLSYGESPTHTYNVIVDHVSVEWACDDSTSVWGNVTDVTYQWMLVAEGLDGNDFPDANSKGLLVGGTVTGASITLSVHHNLYANTASRLPNLSHVKVADYRNNITYNWSSCSAASFGVVKNDAGGNESVFVNFVGNQYIQGPSNASDCVYFGTVGGDETQIYLSDNTSPTCQNGCASSEWDIGIVDGPTLQSGGPYVLASESQYGTSTPFDVPEVTTDPVANLEGKLVANVGATKPVRDSLDSRIIDELQKRTGDVGRDGDSYPTLAAGEAPIDTDHDGMPDDWETAHALNPNDSNDGSATASNGYTNVENYLNELAGDPVCP